MSNVFQYPENLVTSMPLSHYRRLFVLMPLSLVVITSACLLMEYMMFSRLCCQEARVTPVDEDTNERTDRQAETSAASVTEAESAGSNVTTNQEVSISDDAIETVAQTPTLLESAVPDVDI